MTDFDATDFVKRLLKVNNPNYDSMTYAVPHEDIIECLSACTDLVRSQPVLVETEAPMTIGGDIHGQYNDLLKIFQRCGAPSKQNPYMFLGDYVDRGKQQLETICLLMGYKLMYPDSFYILRGNHECPSINVTYGFYDECKRRYSVQIYNLFQEFFSYLPLAGLVGDRLFCMHGGLSPRLKSWDQLSDTRLPRPIREPQDYSLASDLLWADPAKEVYGYARSSRGVSFCFGEDVVHRFCEEMDIDLIVRAHQVVQDGYEFFADRKLVTVFSAPRYCGEEDNLGAVLHVNRDLKCDFTTIAGGRHKIRRLVRRAETPIRK